MSSASVAPRLDVWPPLPPTAHLRRRRLPPFPLAAADCRLYARARHGLFQGVRALGLRVGDEVLTPAYHHGSEIEALVRAGVSCRFYAGDGTLSPDEAELAQLSGPRTRALYLTHYLGYPQDVPRWRRWCDRRGMLLIEDAAQAWLADWEGTPVGSWGELAAFCLYKTVGVPDGAAVRSPGGRSTTDDVGAAGLRPLLSAHVAHIASRSALAARLVRSGKLSSEVPYDPADDFALGNLGPPSRTTLRLLPKVSDPAIPVLRRRNAVALLARLGEHVQPPFDTVPAGASPFAFPVRVQDPSRVVRRLAAAGIGALHFWSTPHRLLPAAGFPDAAGRRASTVGLPVHQELRPIDLDRIVAAVRAAI